MLHVQFLSTQVDFEVEDVIAERLVDADPSVDGANAEEDEQDDNELLRVHDDDDEVSIMSFERVAAEDEKEEEEEGSQTGGRRAAGGGVPPPRLKIFKQWEYSEDTEELGVAQVFAEVGDLMKYMKALRGEVRKLHGTMRAMSAVTNTAGAATASGEEKKERKNILSTAKRY